jgi:hypothetical protein
MLTFSRPLKVAMLCSWAREHDHLDVIRAAAWAHTEWVLREAWGAMLETLP